MITKFIRIEVSNERPNESNIYPMRFVIDISADRPTAKVVLESPSGPTFASGEFTHKQLQDLADHLNNALSQLESA